MSHLGELSGLVYRPAAREAVPVVGCAPPLDPTRPFRVLTWNLQFGASRRRQFFYDGGDAVHVDPADRDWAVANITRELRTIDADLLLLQEIDRDSDRTGRLDQLVLLQEALTYPVQVSAPYHRSRYLPYPNIRHFGRIDFSLALFSRFGLQEAERVQLPLLHEPRWRRAFNLKRCLLHTKVPVLGRAPLHLGVTHLSFFTRGDGTLTEQVNVLAEWMDARKTAGESFVLGGDLNLLPPGDDPRRLGDQAVEFADAPNPIERLIPRFRSVIPPERLLDPANATYLPWGAARPDRVLDYLFVSDDIEVLAAGVWNEAEPVSDHVPLVATLQLPAC